MPQRTMPPGDAQDRPGFEGQEYTINKRATETGYGASVQDIDAGYLTIANADTDSRIGVLPMPERSITEVDRLPIDFEQQGFLPRPSVAIDR